MLQKSLYLHLNALAIQILITRGYLKGMFRFRRKERGSGMFHLLQRKPSEDVETELTIKIGDSEFSPNVVGLIAWMRRQTISACFHRYRDFLC